MEVNPYSLICVLKELKTIEAQVFVLNLAIKHDKTLLKNPEVERWALKICDSASEVTEAVNAW